MNALLRSRHAVVPSTPSPVLRRCACGGASGPGGECEECRRKRLQRSAAAAGPALAPAIVHDVLAAPGRPLDAGVRAELEPRFGHSFAHVRVHDDARAARSAQAVRAHAYTVGRSVVFGAGEYAPHTPRGRGLLAHELAHVVQQGGAVPSAGAAIEVGAAGDQHEREAERVAAGAGTVVAGRRRPAVQRQEWSERLRLVPPLHLDSLPPQPLIRPGSLRETYVIPAPPVIRLQEPSFRSGGEGPRVHLLDTQLQGPPPFAPVFLIPVPARLPGRAAGDLADRDRGRAPGGAHPVTAPSLSTRASA